MTGDAHDVFISYGSGDRPWAERLNTELQQRGLTTFLDRENLRAGSRWEPQLVAALQQSRNLVALWSDAAAQSTWVSQEIYRFVQIIDPSAAGPPLAGQIIVVELEGSNESLRSYQKITALREAGVYAAGSEQVDDDLWRQVADRIEEDIRGPEGWTMVPLLICTTTRERLEQVDSAAPTASGPSLDSLLGDLGIGTKDDLLGHYGERRSDWRPFGSQHDVRGILEGLRVEMNRELRDMLMDVDQDAPPIRFRWKYLRDEFWTGGDAEVTDLTTQLVRGPAVIVVDPLAFYDELVRERYTNRLYPRAFRNRDAFVLVLAPFALPASSQLLRDTIRQMARQVAEHFYQPPVFARYARSSTQIGDQLDLKGWLMTALAPHVVTWRRANQPAVVFTDTDTSYQ